MNEMNPEQRRRIKRLREKIVEKNRQIKEEEEAKIAEELNNAKVITLYDKEKCATPGCERNAVGSGDRCRECGGDPVIRENLLEADEIPDGILQITKYDPAFHPMEFLRLAQNGMAEVEIAAEFMVSVYTMRGWSEKYKDFNTAYEIGQGLYEAWWQREGKNHLDDRGYNTGLFKYLTMNNLGWSDKMESKNLNINAGVLLAPAQIDDKSWEKKYGKG